MIPNDSNDFRRAMELRLQARREALEEGDARWLESYLSDHPEAAGEASATDAFLERLEGARIPVRDAFREELTRKLGGLAREAEIRGRTASVPEARTWPARVAAFLFGRDPRPRAPSLGTQLLGRSLAFYLGICLAVCLWLWTEPQEPTASAGLNGGESALQRVLPLDGDRDGPTSDSRPIRGR